MLGIAGIYIKFYSFLSENNIIDLCKYFCVKLRDDTYKSIMNLNKK